jgi:tetratricopeptide (TPR) repeat protein
MGEICMTLLGLAWGLAPAPPPRSDPRIEARLQRAKSDLKEAARLNQNFLLGEHQSARRRQECQEQYSRLVLRAAQELSALARQLASPEYRSPWARARKTEVVFLAAKAWFNLGRYDEAIRFYEELAGGSAKPLEQVDALGGLVSCYAAKGEIEKVRQRLRRIRGLLRRLDEPKRRDWERWLDTAEASLQR